MNYFSYFFRLHRATFLATTISGFILVGVLLISINILIPSQTNPTQRPIAQPLSLSNSPKPSEILLSTLPTTGMDIAELIHHQAESNGVTIEEISYETRQEQDLPVDLRHASFTLTTNYTTIRHYLDSVIHAQTNLTLDALDCSRTDISSPDVNCVITLTALQQRQPRVAEESYVH